MRTELLFKNPAQGPLQLLEVGVLETVVASHVRRDVPHLCSIWVERNRSSCDRQRPLPDSRRGVVCMETPEDTRPTAGPGVALPVHVGVLAVVVAVLVALQLFVGGRFLPQGWVQFAVGFLLIGVGLGLLAWAGRTMFAGRGNPNPFRDSSQLVSGGPFRFSRNPMHIAFTIVFFGIACVFNGAWLLILPVYYVLAVNLQAAREERYLEMQFGEPYLQYKRQVRRWI
jgi:protein-S-isoprenylcysteine O-methyltransferase Ste14